MNPFNAITGTGFDVLMATQSVRKLTPQDEAQIAAEIRAAAVELGMEPARATELAARLAAATLRFSTACGEAAGASADLLQALSEVSNTAAGMAAGKSEETT